MANWDDAETRILLSLRAEEEINKNFMGTVKDGVLLEWIAKLMQERGFKHNKNQVTSKLKTLKKKYH